MNGDPVTWVGLPALGLVLIAVGVGAHRHLDDLVGRHIDEEWREQRRGSLARGASAAVIAGVFLVIGGLVAAAASARS